MSTEQAQDEYFVAKEIFRQLQASKVNGFPFFAYTGIKSIEKTQNGLTLHFPKNPSKFCRVDITLNDMDTYDLKFINPKKSAYEVDDLYWDQLAQVIAMNMGVL